MLTTISDYINAFADWLAENPIFMRYIAYGAWACELILVIDLIFGIHWVRDLFIPFAFTALLAMIYIFA